MIVNIGKDIELNVDVTKLPENVRAHVEYIGLRNILMDAHASVTKESSANVYADSLAVAEKKLAAMYNGEIRVASSRTGDPVRALAIKLATNAIVADWTAKNPTRKKTELDAKSVREAAVVLIGRNEKYLATARVTIESTKAIDADIDDLTAGL